MRVSSGLDFIAFLKSKDLQIQGMALAPSTNRVDFDVDMTPEQHAALQSEWLNSPLRRFLRDFQDLQHAVADLRGGSLFRRREKGGRPEAAT